MLKKKLRQTRNVVLSLESMESRELLTGAPVQFQSGALASHATEPYATQGDTSSSYILWVGSSTVMTSSDIYGGPIDINNDGFADVITYGNTFEQIMFGQSPPLVAGTRGPSANILLGTGTGFKLLNGFNPYVGLPTGKGSAVYQQAAVLDINSDGYDEVISFSQAPNRVVVNQFDPTTGKMSETVESFLNLYEHKTCGTMTMADVNGDTLPDLLLPLYDSPIAGTNPEVLSYALSGYSVYLAKAEADGSWIGRFESDPLATISLKSPLSNVISSHNVGLAWLTTVSTNNPGILVDLNGDGLKDMVVPESDGLTIFPNPGNGQFSQASGIFISSGTGQMAANLQIGDLNGDGKPDLISSSNPVSQQLNNLNTNPVTWDGNHSPISVYLNSGSIVGDIAFSVSHYDGFGGSGQGYNGALALADFNQDGILDLTIGSAAPNDHLVGVATGNGVGGFDPLKLTVGYSNSVDPYFSNIQRGIYSIGTADFNNDGQIDIVTSAAVLNASDSINDELGIVGISFNSTFAPITVKPATVPTGTVGTAYSTQLGRTGGNPYLPYTYSLDPRSFVLPAGLTLSPDGIISGTPEQSGHFQILVKVSQPSGLSGSTMVNLSIQNGVPAAITPGILPNAVSGVTYHQQLVNTAGPSSWSLTGGTLPPGISLTTDGLLSGLPTTIGQYTFQVSSTGAGIQSAITYQMIIQGAAAPVVTNLSRYGYHGQSTTFVAAFSQPMDLASASLLANYSLVSAGRDGIIGTRDDRRVALRSVIYDTQTQEATIFPVARNLQLHQKYQLTIIGTPNNGVKNEAGTFLGGQGVGAAGTNFVKYFGSEILAGPNDMLKIQTLKRQARLQGRKLAARSLRVR